MSRDKRDDVGNGENSFEDSYSRKIREEIGHQGEFYCRSLFGLAKIRDGNNRPDLVSVNGSYEPKFAMEVKTARDNAVIHPYCLTYAFGSKSAYVQNFGEPDISPNPEMEIADLNVHRFRKPDQVAFYYNFVRRTDNLHAADFNNPFGNLGIRIGDQIMVPHGLIFHYYVAQKLMRQNPHKKASEFTREDYDGEFSNVGKIVLNMLQGGHDYSKGRIPAHFNDFLSIFMNDPSLLTTDSARNRIDILTRFYGDENLTNLRRTYFIGPNNTHIYALHKDEHSSIFLDGMKRKIAERRGLVEKIDKQRRRVHDKIKNGYSLANNVNVTQLELAPPNAPGDNLASALPVIPLSGLPQLDDRKIKTLERIARWQGEEDDGRPEFIDVDPDILEKDEPPSDRPKELF